MFGVGVATKSFGSGAKSFDSGAKSFGEAIAGWVVVTSLGSSKAVWITASSRSTLFSIAGAALLDKFIPTNCCEGLFKRAGGVFAEPFDRVLVGG